MSRLLQTKIQLPPLRSQHIKRERIWQQIDSTPDMSLVLVSAPAGFGKSTCLIEWAHHLRAQGVGVAWYALDEHDDDPARFAAYLLQACQSVYPDLVAQPDTPEQVDLHDAVNRILNAASDSSQPLVLILDDYQLIETDWIHDPIKRMCDHMPSNMRLAIGTRADPPLQLTRMRALGEIAEIRMTDLRFTRAEIADWLQTTCGLTASSDFLGELDRLTEGWAAALTIIMTGQSDTSEQALKQQIAGYSQSQRYTFYYFAEEVLDKQPDTIRQFLLDTCVLDQLEHGSCHALTDSSDAPLLLDRLATQNMFIIPLSDETPVYRYHHLFAHFLRQYLDLHDHERYLQQHRRASDWYVQHGQIVQAVHHALLAGDHDNAAELIVDRAWETLTARGEILTIIRWLSWYPEPILQHYPRLCLYFSRALYLLGDIEKSQDHVQIAIDHLAVDTDRYQTLQAIAFGYQATLSAYQGDVRAAQQWVERANTLRDHVDGVDRVRIANTDAFLSYLTASLPEARAAYEQALSLAEAIEHDFLRLDAQFYLAQIDLLAAEIQAVEDRCEHLLAQYPNRIAPLSAIMLPLARVQYQRNQVIQAETTLRDAIRLAQHARLSDILWLTYINLAEVLALTDIREARELIRQAQLAASKFQSPIMLSIIKAAEAYLMLRCGEIEQAAAWAETFQPDAVHHQHYEVSILGRVKLAQGQFETALTVFEQLITDAQDNGRVWYVITGKCLQALTCHAASETGRAVSILQDSLQLAQPRRVIRLFLDESPPMLDLLRDVRRHEGVASEYAAWLLDIAAQADTIQHPADVLTDREIEVLQHIATGASNNDIAEALVLSVGTIKSHVHHIMNKLHASNRTEAVSRARSLNILHD